MVYLRLFLFAAELVSAVWISLYLSKKAYKDCLAKQLLAFGVLFPLVLFTSIFLPALCGVLYFFTPAVLLLISSAVFVLCEKRRAQLGWSNPCEPHPVSLGYRNIGVIILLFFACGLVFGRFFYNGTHFGGDDFSYHPAFIMSLVQDHSLVISDRDYTAHFPFNAEFYTGAFVLPLSRDYLAGLAGFYWFGLLLLIFFYWGHIGSFTKWQFIVGCSIFLLTPNIQQAIATYTAVDMAAPIMMLASVMFILPHQDRSDIPRNDLIFSGLCAGFAVGCKVTMGFLAGWLVLSVFRRQQKLPWKQLFCSLGILIFCMLLTGGFSYIRNFALTGNPFFPASIGPIEGPFGREQQNTTKLLYWILNDPVNGANWKVILGTYINWPAVLFLFAATGYGFSLRYCTGRGACDKNQLFAKRLLFWMGASLFVLYPVIPFSGSPNSPDAPLALSIRYLLFSYIIGIFLLLMETARYQYLGRYISIIFLTALSIRYGLELSKIAMTVVVLCGFWVAVSFCLRYRQEILLCVQDRKRAAAGMAAFICGFLIFFPQYQNLTDSRVFTYRGQRLADVLMAVEELLPDGARYCFFGVNYQLYPFWGRRFQFRPVKTDRNGQPRDLYYQLWKNHPEQAIFWHNSQVPLETAVLVENLICNKMDYVVTSKDLTGDWPIQQMILQADKHAQKIYEDADNCIWKIEQK